jgi:hypothetical protein
MKNKTYKMNELVLCLKEAREDSKRDVPNPDCRDQYVIERLLNEIQKLGIVIVNDEYEKGEKEELWENDDFRNELKDELRNDVIEDVRNELRDDEFFREEIGRDIVEERFKKKLKDSLKNEIWTEITTLSFWD